MRILVDSAIRSDHGALRALVAAAFEGLEEGEVEIRLRACGRSDRSFTGRAYPRPPSRARAAPGTRFLVILFVPTVLRNRGYPKTHRYPRLRTAPWITTRDWRERLVALAAHEACHIRQFRDGLRRSEVEAERWAKSVLEQWGSRERADGSAIVGDRPSAMTEAARQLRFDFAM